jgi:hypothetical protein
MRRSRQHQRSSRLSLATLVAAATVVVALSAPGSALASHCTPHAQTPVRVPDGVIGRGYLSCGSGSHTTSWTITLQILSGGSWVIASSRTQSANLHNTTYTVFTATVACRRGFWYRSRLTSTTISTSGAVVPCPN